MTGLSNRGLSHVSEFQLRAILDSIPARVALIDRERRHLYINQEYARFTGRPAEEVVGRTVVEMIGPAAFAMVGAFGERAMQGETVTWDGWLPYTGETRYVQRVYMPYRNEVGVVDGYFVFARDLTDLKRSEALNAAITASALDCIITIDESSRVVEFNPAAERLFGLIRSETLGRRIGDLIVPPHLRARHTAGFERYLRTGEASLLGRRVEVEAMRADGTVFPAELTITEIRIPDRRLFTAYLRDLTPARTAQAELERSREALHQSEKMAAFGSLLAGVAHELNNPLSIVIGHALMLQEEAEEAGLPGLAGRAEKIKSASERCARIVRSFLAMARQRKITVRVVEVRPLIEGALDLLAYGLGTRGIEVALDLPHAPVAVMGDPDQLSQVLLNLLVNAQQTLEGNKAPRRIEVRVREEGDAVSIQIADNGPGVPAAIRTRIFDPFFTTKPTGSGTGIGLAVSRGIAETHGGRLVLLDGPGPGACFALHLPKASAAHPAEPSPAAASAPEPVCRTALIVDDEREVAGVLAQMLARQGFRCDVANGGREAQRLLLDTEYDAVLCDLHMPDVDGPALFGWMEANRGDLCSRTAFVTGDTLGDAAASFLARARRPVLEKPFTPDEIRRVMEKLCSTPPN